MSPTTIDAATAKQLRLTLPDSADASSGRATEDLSDLNRFKDRDVSAIVAQLSSRLAKARGEIAQLKDQLKDKQTELADADVERLEGDNTSLADTMKKIVITETALTGHHEKVVESDASIKKLKGKLAKIAPANLHTSQIRSELLEQATEVFAGAIERYKADLRGRVEETASKLFLSMTTEKSDYSGLEITKTYGLNLIHSDATVEEGRSAQEAKASKENHARAFKVGDRVRGGESGLEDLRPPALMSEGRPPNGPLPRAARQSRVRRPFEDQRVRVQLA